MALLVTGPIDRDQQEDEIDDIHLEAFNNTPNRVQVVLRVYNADNTPPTQIDFVTETLQPFDRDDLSVDIGGVEHVLVQIEHPLGRNDVHCTVYGRNNNGDALPGATYRHTELFEGGIGVLEF